MPSCCRRRWARSCSWRRGRWSAPARATGAAAATAQPLARFEPGSDIRAQVTILAEGTQGHLTGAAIDRFGLGGDSPQTWALGVKEVWKVPAPLRKIIHTMGWPLRSGARYREFGGSFIYPMGDDMLTIGLVVGLDYTDSELSVHDLLQELKTHPRIRPLLEGGERVAWGAKTIPEGGFVAVPQRLWAPGLLIAGDGAGLVNVPALKGIHYAIESGRLAAEAAWRALAARGAARVAAGLRRVAALVVRLARPAEGAEHAAGVRARLLARGGAGRCRTVTRRPLPAPGPPDAARRRPRADHDRPRLVVSGAGRRADVRQALVGLPVRQPDEGRPAEPHPRADAGARAARRMWERMCPAAVYEDGAGAPTGS